MRRPLPGAHRPRAVGPGLLWSAGHLRTIKREQLVEMSALNDLSRAQIELGLLGILTPMTTAAYVAVWSVRFADALLEAVLASLILSLLCSLVWHKRLLVAEMGRAHQAPKEGTRPVRRVHFESESDRSSSAKDVAAEVEPLQPAEVSKPTRLQAMPRKLQRVSQMSSASSAEGLPSHDTGTGNTSVNTVRVSAPDRLATDSSAPSISTSADATAKVLSTATPFRSSTLSLSSALAPVPATPSKLLPTPPLAEAPSPAAATAADPAAASLVVVADSAAVDKRMEEARQTAIEAAAAARRSPDGHAKLLLRAQALRQARAAGGDELAKAAAMAEAVREAEARKVEEEAAAKADEEAAAAAAAKEAAAAKAVKEAAIAKAAEEVAVAKAAEEAASAKAAEEEAAQRAVEQAAKEAAAAKAAREARMAAFAASKARAAEEARQANAEEEAAAARVAEEAKARTAAEKAAAAKAAEEAAAAKAVAEAAALAKAIEEATAAQATEKAEAAAAAVLASSSSKLRQSPGARAPAKSLVDTSAPKSVRPRVDTSPPKGATSRALASPPTIQASTPTVPGLSSQPKFSAARGGTSPPPGHIVTPPPARLQRPPLSASGSTRPGVSAKVTDAPVTQVARGTSPPPPRATPEKVDRGALARQRACWHTCPYRTPCHTCVLSCARTAPCTQVAHTRQSVRIHTPAGAEALRQEEARVRAEKLRAKEAKAKPR